MASTIINSSKALCDRQRARLKRAECQQLFIEICGVLAGEGRLAEALAEGTTIRTFQRMTRAAHAWLKCERGIELQSVHAFGSAPRGLDQYWSRLLDHWRSYGSGSILLGMSGRYDHWSCVRSMSDRAISLMDSDGIHLLRRDHCTVAEYTELRRYVLWPTQTLLVTD